MTHIGSFVILEMPAAMTDCTVLHLPLLKHMRLYTDKTLARHEADEYYDGEAYDNSES